MPPLQHDGDQSSSSGESSSSEISRPHLPLVQKLMACFLKDHVEAEEPAPDGRAQLLNSQVELAFDDQKQDSSSMHACALQRVCLLIHCAHRQVPTGPNSFVTKRQMFAHKISNMLSPVTDFLLLVYMASYLFEVPSWCWLDAHLCGDQSVVMRAPMSSTLPLHLSRPLQMVCLLSLVGRTMLEAYAMGFWGFWHTASLMADVFALLDNFMAIFNHYGLPPKTIYWSPLLRPFVFLAHNKASQRFFGDALPAMFQSAVLDLLFLQGAFLAIWACFGILLFNHTDGVGQEGDKHFSDFKSSLLSLFTLFTTANFPDVMMEAYSVNRFYFAYFCTYVILSIYIFFNVLLAAMFSSYKQQVKQTIEVGQKSSRDTLQEGFNILASLDPDGPEGSLTPGTWMDFSDVYSQTPDCAWDYTSMLELFDESDYSHITLEMWQLAVPELTEPTSSLRHHSRNQVSRKETQKQNALGALHLAVDVAAVLSLLCTLYQIQDLTVSKRYLCDVPWYFQVVHFICCGLYVVETVARRAILDDHSFFTPRVLMDMVMGVICLCLEVLMCFIGPGDLLWRGAQLEDKLSRFLALLRVARVERVLWLFEGKRETLRVVLRLVGTFKRACGGLFFVFYLYSTLGVQIFGGRIWEDRDRLEDANFGHGDYWANNFNDFASGLVVLFELMVVNNWYVIAEGLAKVSPGSTYVGWFFCISFYFCVHIVILNVLVASVVGGYERIRDDEAAQRNVVEELRAVTPGTVLSPATALPKAHGEQQDFYAESSSRVGSFLSAPIKSLATEAKRTRVHFCEHALLLDNETKGTMSQLQDKLKELAREDPQDCVE